MARFNPGCFKLKKCFYQKLCPKKGEMKESHQVDCSYISYPVFMGRGKVQTKTNVSSSGIESI